MCNVLIANLFFYYFLGNPMKNTLKGFFKPISKNIDPNPPSTSESEASTAAQKRIRIEFNSNDIIADPSKRKPIEE